MAIPHFEIGEEVIGSSGQKYILDKREPYQRPRNQGLSEVLAWRSNCRQCGVEFTTKSGPTTKGLSVHCPDHKFTKAERVAIALANLNKPGVRAKGRATQAENRRILKSLL